MAMAADGDLAALQEAGPAHEIEVQAVVDTTGLPDAERIRAWVGAALQGRDQPLEMVVRIVDEAEIQDLNQRFRQRDRPTNVLSFPSGPVAAPPPGFGGDAQAPALLGDLVICAPVVRREADEQGKTIDAHFAHMVVHGVLHLLGYDHLDDDEAAAMEAAECRILQALGFGDPYRHPA